LVQIGENRFIHENFPHCDGQWLQSFATQVEEMYKKNQGHGICGSKNLYSSNVKLGNWVEDKVGLQLTQQELPVYKNYMSNTNLSYQDPKDQPPLPSMPVNMPTTQELKAKNKEGMQYSLIFDHGLKEIPPEVIFFTSAHHYPTSYRIIIHN